MSLSSQVSNATILAEFNKLKLMDNGIWRSANTMHITDLKRHCEHPVVAEFALLLLKLCHSSDCTAKMNVTADSADSVSLIPGWVNLMLSLVFIAVGCIGLIGNLLTVCVIYKTKTLHSHTNYFLASLAVSDMCLIIVGVPFDLVRLWRKTEPPGMTGYCEFMSTSISLFTFASILTIVSLTAERYVAICYPFSVRNLFDKRRVRQVIYAIWIVAFFPSLYIGLQFKQVTEDFCGYNRELDPPVGNCDYATSQNMPFRYPFEVTMLLTFILPLLFIVYCYVRILYTLSKMSRKTTVHIPLAVQNSDCSQVPPPTPAPVSTEPRSILYVHTKNSAPPKSQQAQKMVIKMLVTVTVVFFLCYLPYHVERLIAQYNKQLCQQSTVCLLLYPITGLLQYVSATLNPIFYNLMSLRFRTAFKGTFYDLKRRYIDCNSIARL